MFKNKRVFISGGNGVIGNQLVEKLHQMGAIIFVGDLKFRPENWDQSVRYRQGDLNFIHKEELYEFAPEYFFHLAATFERSTETYAFWEENFKHNVNLSNHLMTCLKDCPSLKKVVFASSYLIYDPSLYQFEQPTPTPFSLKEDAPIYPRNLTGVAKLSHEIELRFINSFKHEQYKIVSARIFRGHGCNSRDVISRWVRMLIHNEKLTVFCKEGIFDYIYSKDTAEGLIKLALSENAEGIVNLGTGKSRSVTNILDILKKHFPNMQYTEETQKEMLYEASQANTSLLKRLTGWEPEYSLEKSIEEIIAFEQNRNGIYNSEPPIPINILVTSIAKKVPLLQNVKFALNKLNSNNLLWGGDIDETAIGQHFVDQFWKMPFLDDNALETIIKYCQTNNIKGIIPSRDGELVFWAKNKPKLNSVGINVMVSDINAIKLTINKLAFSEFLVSKKLPAIKTATNINDLECSHFVVKEQFGAGSLSIGLNLTKGQAITHAQKLENPIFQPYIQGKEYSVDIYMDKQRNAHGVIVRSRDKVVNGESQITTTEKKPLLEELAIQTAKSLNIQGHAVLQILEDVNSAYHIIECNARFGGASTLSITAGLDSFYWFILETIGCDIFKYPFIPSPVAIKQIRYACDKIIYK